MFYLLNYYVFLWLFLPIHNYLLKSYTPKNNNDREVFHGHCVPKILVNMLLSQHCKSHTYLAYTFTNRSMSVGCFR